ncbi:MAG: Mov34/MPN/PAD-1 family protein [Planctomycetes bacterium]|nr:Mov34/MPN/PAD-1 family protein [Planctomycetota bacterium]
MRDDRPIRLSASLRERLLASVAHRLPWKSFGYLVSDVDDRTPTDFVLFEANVRNSGAWKGTFEAYGRYLVDHEDAGFVATSDESWRVQKEIWSRGLVEIGVFHSHLRHPANFSRIDFDLHRQRYRHLWHLIVSMRAVEQPQLRVFDCTEAGVRELPIAVPGAPAAECRRDDGRSAAGRAIDRSGGPPGVPRGSFHALAEMCRTQYRFHEPPGFRAADVGFRLASDGDHDTKEAPAWSA